MKTCNWKKEPRKVVIVDDECDVVALVVKILKAAGFEAWGTTSAMEALRKIKQATPDLVITDMDMPGLDGNEFTTVLKSHPDSCRIPVVFLSGKTSSEDHGIAYFSGAAGYIEKPFVPADLLTRLAEFVGP